jgi:hypothetical protein
MYWKQAASLHYTFQPVDVNKGCGGWGRGEKSTNYMILLFLRHLGIYQMPLRYSSENYTEGAEVFGKTAHSWKCFANNFFLLGSLSGMTVIAVLGLPQECFYHYREKYANFGLGFRIRIHRSQR